MGVIDQLERLIMYEFTVIDVEEGILAETPLRLSYAEAVARRMYVHRFFKFDVEVTITPIKEVS